jgi:glycosyltransferase involved in cell wall biosynthesis
VGPRVHFAGVQREPALWYTAGDCLVSTSYYDTFPNVVLEAMYCERAVVVPKHDPPHVYAGAAEIVTRHGGGRIYDRRRPGALAAVLRELRAGRETTSTLGREAGRIARQTFGWGECIERITELAG